MSENIKVVNDGDKINKADVENWGIKDYCNRYNDKITINFVGFVLKYKRIFYSFPKNYYIDKESEDIKTLMKNVIKILLLTRSSGDYKNDDENEGFPLEAYQFVLSYYKNHGLYTTEEESFRNGFEGKINWKKTIKESEKILTENGIIFLPFVLYEKKDTIIFISKCMDYLLNDCVDYIDYIDCIVPYKKKFKHLEFENFKYICNQLIKLKNNFFKDSEKKLINALIEYFHWKSKYKDKKMILTTKFENCWEMLIKEYLNHKFYKYKEDKICWKENKIKKKFEKLTEDIEPSNEKKEKEKHFKIEYDHFFEDNAENIVYIFDSKYFKGDKLKLNYKQMIYHYHLKQKYLKSKIINGLILPIPMNNLKNKKEYYTENHVDRSKEDGVKITEHYLNIREIINFIAEKSDNLV